MFGKKKKETVERAIDDRHEKSSSERNQNFSFEKLSRDMGMLESHFPFFFWNVFYYSLSSCKK